MNTLAKALVMAGCIASAGASDIFTAPSRLTAKKFLDEDSSSSFPTLSVRDPGPIASTKNDFDPVRASAPAITTETYTFGGTPIPMEIPDTGVPVSDTRNINSSAIIEIDHVQISVHLSNPNQAGAYNGDYYLTLQHSSGFSVLLNRVGRRDEPGTPAALGYGDNGFNVTFRDDATLGDIHNYRVTLEGDNNTPIDPTYSAALTGEWAPDGRETSPLSVFSYDNRTALLSSFNGLGANGSWTLQAVDFNNGGVAKIDGWSITVTGTIPEPSTATGAIALAALYALVRKGGKGGAPRAARRKQ